MTYLWGDAADYVQKREKDMIKVVYDAQRRKGS